MLTFTLVAVGVLVGIPAILAAVFLRWITVKEGTYVDFLYRGKHAFSIFSFTGYKFDALGFIVPGNGPTSLGECWCIKKYGGWVFYLDIFVTPVQYRDHSEDDGFGEGVYVNLNEMQYTFALDGALTAKPENVTLDITGVYVMRIVHPRLYLFKAPKDAKKQITATIDGLLRGWVKSGNEEHAQNAKGNGTQLWADLVQPVDAAHPGALNCQPVFDKLRDDWGVEIKPDSTIVVDIDYDEEFRNALKAKAQQELQAEADKAKQDLEADAFANQTSGAEIAMISKWTGKSIEEIQKEITDAIKADPDHGFENWLKRYPIIQKNWSLISQKQLGVRPNLFGNADGTSLDPIVAVLASLIGLAKGAPAGNGGASGRTIIPPVPPRS